MLDIDDNHIVLRLEDLNINIEVVDKTDMVENKENVKNIEEKYCRRPHVVIVGAGASRAVMGEVCPTMNEAIEQVGLDNILQGIVLKTKSRNLEDIYSELFDRGEECKEARIAMEKALYNYFSEVHLPPLTMTIYDQLILSLTEKDCIISFNWDSLLIQAYNRALKITRNCPNLLFLHGNVGAGACEDCGTFGRLVYGHCRKCGKQFLPVPLLYPVKQKDYNSNIFIRGQWSAAKEFLAVAGKVTIYGYSAPSSDKEACEILKSAFSKYKNVHQFDTVEIIERPGFDTDDISDTWEYFFSTVEYRYNIVDDFYKSSLAEAPRRTIQSQYKQLYEGSWEDFSTISFSKNDTFESVTTLLKPLLDNEKEGNYSVI